MSLSINTTVPSAPSTEPTPMSNTLNDDDEVELMLVKSPTTTINELHDRAAASGNVISLVSPGASPPPLQHEGRGQEGEGGGEGGGGLLFGRDEVSQFGRGGMSRSTVEHRVLTNTSKSKKSTAKSKSKSKPKKSKSKTDKGTKSAKSDKGTKSTKASKSDASDKGTKDSKSEHQFDFLWAFNRTVFLALLLLLLYKLDIIRGFDAIIPLYLWMSLNVVDFFDGFDIKASKSDTSDKGTTSTKKSKSKSDKGTNASKSESQPDLQDVLKGAVMWNLILFLLYRFGIIGKFATSIFVAFWTIVFVCALYDY